MDERRSVLSARIWTDHAGIVAQLRRHWEAGAVLAEVAGAPTVFPLRIRMTTPTTAELSSRFDDVRAWIRDLLAADLVRVELAGMGGRSIGRNEIPRAVWVDTLDDAAALLGEEAALASLRGVVAITPPSLLPWVAARPLVGVALADQWERLLRVVAWLAANPQPGIYVRQVDIGGVDTKFIERHGDVIASMHGDVEPRTDFVTRFGFLNVPRTIAIRSLCPSVKIGGGSAGFGDRPVTLTLEDASRITGVRRVFVTENYVNFLSFPPAAGSVVIFGGGFDVGRVALLPWTANVPVHYWGDIDTHGFAILDMLRAVLPHTTSMLMDHDTLHAHELQWGTEPVQVRRGLPHLTPAERALYDDLRDNRIRPNLRFEQELTSFGFVERYIATVTR